MDYLHAQYGRIFVSALSVGVQGDEAPVTWNWRAFASNSYSAPRQEKFGNQFGVSFGGAVVGDQAAWEAAAGELRAAAATSLMGS